MLRVFFAPFTILLHHQFFRGINLVAVRDVVLRFALGAD
jgi:hypothetical protein